MLKKIKSFSFTGHFGVFAIISAVLVSVGIVSLLLTAFGVKNVFNFDIDFVGGTSINLELHEQATKQTTDQIEALFTSTLGLKPSSVTTGGEHGITVKSVELNDQQRIDFLEAVSQAYGLTDDDCTVNYVSASVGSTLAKTALLASLLAIALILVYIGIRFEFKSGIAAVCALLHDLLVMLSMYVIFRIPFNINFIAAALTILGYSINATIVVFDRVRENEKLNLDHVPFAKIVDRSIWETMSRSLNTTVTTLLVMLMLLILGVSSIRNFALPLCIGIVCGCYSSVCISGPMWSLMNRKNKKTAA